MNAHGLSMTLPVGFIEAVDRRHNGNQSRTHEERAKSLYIMEKLIARNRLYVIKEDNLLNVEWKENNIEGHFMQSKWYNAHTKLDRYRKIILDTHRAMFQLLVYLDGNTGERFSQFESIPAEEIYEDFKDKYLNSEEGVKK